MRIAIGVEGTRGDVHPMLALAASLRAAGHDVQLCAPPDFRDDAASRGVAFTGVGRSARELLAEMAESVHGGALAVLKAAGEIFQSNTPLQFRDFANAAAGADLLLAAGTHVAAASYAELHGVPYRYVAYCPALLPNLEHPPLFMPYRRWPSWVTRVLWWLCLPLVNLSMRGTINRCRAGLGLAPVGDVTWHVMSERPLLATDEPLAPAPAGTPRPVEAIGCLHPFEAGPLPPKLESFLEQGNPPVYIGFGSMTDPAPAATTALVLDAAREAGVRLLVSEGWAGLGDGALPGDVMVIGPVSHAALFRRVAAVVHHGGAGTTTTAARAGAAQIVVPHLLDQFYWSHRVTELGLGPPGIPRARLCRENLAEALRAVRDNDTLSGRAADFGAELRSRLAARGDPAAVVLG